MAEQVQQQTINQGDGRRQKGVGAACTLPQS
jgi:hypothetical protein